MKHLKMTRYEERKLVAEYFRKILPKEFEMIDVDYEMIYSRFIVYWRSCDYKDKSNGRSYFAAGHIYLRSKDWKYQIEKQGYNIVKDIWEGWNKIVNSNEYELMKGE